MIKIILITSCFLALNFSFLIGGLFSIFKDDRSKGELLVDEVLKKIRNHVEKKYEIIAIGTNVAMPGGPIKLLGLEFQINHPLTKSEARQKLVECANDFLKIINTYDEIKPYLKTYPFTLENISITLFIKDKGHDLYDPYLNTASIDDDGLMYTTTDQANPYKFKTRVKESYEEALNELTKANR